MGELLYSGKVKQVWSTEDPDIIEFRYTDQISVFDQIIPSLIPRKGESLNRSSCHWLKMVEDAGICKTHMIEMTAPDRVRARRFEVIREPGAIPQDMENVFVPLEVICRHHLAGSGWRRYKKGDASAEEFGLKNICDLKGRQLSGGQRRKVEIARTLVSNPRMILLDEPFAGIDPIAIEDIKSVLRKLKSKNIGILITDHNVRETLELCDNAAIINSGEIIAYGTKEDLISNKKVREVYLGNMYK